MDQELKQIKPSQVFACLVAELEFRNPRHEEERPVKKIEGRFQMTTYPERRLRIDDGSEYKTSISVVLTQLSYCGTTIDQDSASLKVSGEEPGFSSFILEKVIRLPSTEEEFTSLMKKAIADLKQIHAAIIAL